MFCNIAPETTLLCQINHFTFLFFEIRSYRSSNEASNSTHNIESTKTTPSTNEKIVITSSKSSTTIPFQSPLSSSSSSSSSSTTNEHHTSPIEQTVEKLLKSCNNILFELNETQLSVTNKESKITTDSINTSECEIKRKKKINKLERRLSNLSKTIRQLEETDMSLDEMEHCDLYVVESNLKKRAYEVHIKLAELKRQSSSVERILDQPVTLTKTLTGHPLINKALEDMVNQTKFLPSFNDVLDTVEKTNDKYQLNLSPDARKNHAEKSFKIIGNKVKDRRMADFNDIMNSRLPEDFNIEENDPALNSIEIEKALSENEREATIKTEKILEEYSQIDPDIEPEVNIESSEELPSDSDEDEKSDEEKEEVESESESNIKSSDNKPNEIHYDIVDILPPFSPETSSSSSPAVIDTLNDTDPLDVTVEIPLHDRTLTILSTASLPIKRTTCDSFTSVYTVLDENDTQESQPTSTIQEHMIKTITPRRRHLKIVNEPSSSFFKKRSTTNDSSIAQRRSLSTDKESSKSKILKKQPEIVILD